MIRVLRARRDPPTIVIYNFFRWTDWYGERCRFGCSFAQSCDAALNRLLESCGWGEKKDGRYDEPPPSLMARFDESCRAKRAKLSKLEHAWHKAEANASYTSTY